MQKGRWDQHADSGAGTHAVYIVALPWCNDSWSSTCGDCMLVVSCVLLSDIVCFLSCTVLYVCAGES
jgi:hypothetical protein